MCNHRGELSSSVMLCLFVRQVAGSFGLVFAIDWPKVMMDVWIFISSIVQIDFIRFPVSMHSSSHDLFDGNFWLIETTCASMHIIANTCKHSYLRIQTAALLHAHTWPQKHTYAKNMHAYTRTHT